MRPQAIRACFFRMRSLGCSFRHMSDALAVSQRQLYRWQRAPLLMARPLDRSHLRRKTTTAIGDAVICWVTRHNVATLDAIREHLRSSRSVLPSKQSISRMLRERNWTRKRGTKAYTEADASRGAQFSRSIAAGLSSPSTSVLSSSTTADTTPGPSRHPSCGQEARTAWESLFAPVVHRTQWVHLLVPL